MKIQNQKINDGEIYTVEGTTPGYINAIRRYAMSYVPTLAIEDLEIVKNNSILYDEILAHRLGLIPLTTDLSSYTLPEGEVTAMNSVVLTVSATGPKTVYAKDIQTKDPKVKPAFGDIPIVKLLPGQEIELAMTAVMGQGKEHAKWSACNAYHQYKPTITVNNNSSKLQEFISKYPPQVIKAGKIDKESINTPELIDACDGICDDIVKVTYSNETLSLSIESFGQLEPKEIIIEALHQFTMQLDELKEKIKEIKN